MQFRSLENSKGLPSMFRAICYDPVYMRSTLDNVLSFTYNIDIDREID